MTKKIIYIFLSAFILSSCVKEAKIKLPPAENKLVVVSFIAPGDTLLTATVRYSTPKYNAGWYGVGGYQNIPDAIVTISDGTTLVNLIYDFNFDCYRASANTLPIIRGKTYYLDVRTPDGKTASANTKVPEGNLEISSVDASISKEDTYQIDYNLAVTVKDIPGTNYVNIITQDIASDFPNDPPVLLDNYFYMYRFYDTDEKISKERYYTQRSGTMSNGQTISYGGFYISALNCSKDFYLYNQSVEKGVNGEGNPFGDPVLVYTNISNGFGCFGSFTKTELLKRIR